MLLEGQHRVIDEMLPRFQQVMRQTTARRSDGKIVSLFEPSTEVIRNATRARPENLASW